MKKPSGHWMVASLVTLLLAAYVGCTNSGAVTMTGVPLETSAPPQLLTETPTVESNTSVVIFLIYNITVGQTTRDELNILLGKPCESEVLEDGDLYLYYHMPEGYMPRWNRKKCPVRAHFSGDGVEETTIDVRVEMFLCEDNHIADITAVLGEPEIAARTCVKGEAPHHIPQCTAVRLAYPAQGIAAFISSPGEWPLEPATTIDYMYLTRPGSVESYLERYRLDLFVTPYPWADIYVPDPDE